jgi:hypothetical protein
MKYTIEELGFILYNNRSVNCVKNFIPKDINILRLNKIERILANINSSETRMVEVNLNEFNYDCDDIIINTEDISSLTNIILDNIGKFNNDELNFLNKRGITNTLINRYNLLGLSSISDVNILEKLGATAHPTLNKILSDGIENGGIIIPLFENGVLINCAIRKLQIDFDTLSEKCEKSNTLKYTLACPDVSVWGLDNIEQDEDIYLTEGIFDMMALREMGVKAVSCSSAMWSSLQLYQLIVKKPKRVTIISDNDNIGLNVSRKLRDFFIGYNIETKTIISYIAKDPSEHFFEKNGGISDFTDIEITDDIINSVFDDSFNFIKYLKNRKF